MKVLLDENLPHGLRRLLPGHEAFTTAYMGWSGLENGELLAEAAGAEFDALLTKDSGIPSQQNPSTLPLSIIIMRARSNDLSDILPLVPAVLDALDALTPGRPQVVTVG